MLDETADPRFREPEILFFGIGAQKCGTTWLQSFLRQHEEVCVAPGKELHYWNALSGDVEKQIKGQERVSETRKAKGKTSRTPRLRLKILRNRDQAHSSYAEIMFRRYNGQKVVGEITPDYARLPEATFAQMAALNADTRFILLMRDPVDRLHSSMRKRLRGRASGDRTVKISGDAVIAELKDMIDQNKGIAFERSRYDRTITALENVVAPEKIGLFFYEDIFGNRNADPICDFLSITRKPGNFDHVANAGNPMKDDNDQEFRKLAMSKLAPTYEYMQARFGAALPEQWQRGAQ